MNEVKMCTPVSEGMRMGLKASLILSGAYAILAVLIEIGRQIWLTQDLEFIMLPLVRVAGMLPFGYLFAIFPTVALGIITGGLIGELWKHIGRRVDGLVFALLALVLCAGIAVGLHITFGIRFDLTIPSMPLVESDWLMDGLGALVSYPFLMGIPSILYVLAGALGGYIFWRISMNKRH